MTKITNFVWNPVDDCVISELDGSGAVQAVYTNEPQQYGGVLSQRRGTTTSTLHADALGTTRALTDSTQTSTDTYLNDAWGNQVASTGTTVNPFRWVGRYGYYQDSSTGLVYVRARMYMPTVARWATFDKSTLLSMRSMYIYAANDPVSSILMNGSHSAVLITGLFEVQNNLGIDENIRPRPTSPDDFILVYNLTVNAGHLHTLEECLKKYARCAIAANRAYAKCIANLNNYVYCLAVYNGRIALCATALTACVGTSKDCIVIS